MRADIRGAIIAILEEKRRSGDVLPYVTSDEVARRLGLGIAQVEEEAKTLADIQRGRTINNDYYYI